MTDPIVVRPARYRQFGNTRRPFYLVTNAAFAGAFAIDGEGEIVTLDADRRLGATLTTRTADDADVLVAARGAFLDGLSPDELCGRRVMVMPCGSTPVTPGHIRAVLPTLEQTDVAAQAERSEAFFAAVEDCTAITISDLLRATECDLHPHECDGEWHQQAGPLAPGEQQIAPAGELSLLAGGIAAFDPAARLPISGQLTLRGPVIVHAGYDAGLGAEQERLYRRLSGLYQAPVVVDVDGGIIVSCGPGEDSTESARAAAELERLLAADVGYRTVWEIGFGINSELCLLPGNCGLNEVFGGRNGVLHIGLGLTPGTRFALTFLCPDSAVTTDEGSTLVGRPARRLARTRSASCGCH
jgi:hypothetical protein